MERVNTARDVTHLSPNARR